MTFYLSGTMFYRTLCFLILSSKIFAEFLIVGDAPNTRQGMFASANKILGQIYLYEKGALPEFTGLMVDFGESGFYYDPSHGKNWWNYYFEPIIIGSQEGSKIRYLTKPESLNAFEARRRMTRSEIDPIVKRYIHPLPWIQKKVDRFIDEFFQDFFVIGVHYRGTDKDSEAPRVPYEEVFEKIKESMLLDSLCRIFVATDENAFFQAIRKQFPNQVIGTNAYRSESKTGVHFSAGRKFKNGEEAVIDALLLSKCNLLIRTSSNLSLWSSYLNPDLPVILLNERFAKTLNPE